MQLGRFHLRSGQGRFFAIAHRSAMFQNALKPLTSYALYNASQEHSLVGTGLALYRRRYGVRSANTLLAFFPATCPRGGPTSIERSVVRPLVSATESRRFVNHGAFTPWVMGRLRGNRHDSRLTPGRSDGTPPRDFSRQDTCRIHLTKRPGTPTPRDKPRSFLDHSAKNRKKEDAHT